MDASPKTLPPERVQVVCRVRPSEEYGESCVSVTAGDGGDIITLSGAAREFTASKVFLEESTQQEVYECIGEPSVNYVMRGFGACIFAYGQTGSGKTFTMTGTPSARGLIPRMIESLFWQLVAEYQDFTVHCQYLEIYMEKVRDLFNPSRAKNPWDAPGPRINVRYDGKHVQVENAKRLTFDNDSTLRRLAKDDRDFVDMLSGKLLNDIEQASHHRVVRGHALNAESSRSHALLTLEVTARKPGQQIASSLMLVDLAGSENIGKAQVQGIGKEEAKAINKSLFSLTRCIEALAHGHKVPFRESVLTKMLTPALDGRSCCTLIAALRGDHATETRETLKFTETAVKVAVRPKQTSSEALGVVQGQARDLRAEIDALKQEIAWLKQSETSSDAMNSMLAQREAALREKMDSLGALQREIRETEDHLAAIQRELDASKQEIEQERAKRFRAEAENALLLARLGEAEARTATERQVEMLNVRKNFQQQRQRILAELTSAKEREQPEEVMGKLVHLLRRIKDELGARVDNEAHHACRHLHQEVCALLECLERCLQAFPELNARIFYLKFITREIYSQSERLDMLCEHGVGIAELDIAKYNSVLDEVSRLGSRSSHALLERRLQALAEGVEDYSSDAASHGAASLHALLGRAISPLVEFLPQWQVYARVWGEHWRIRAGDAADAFNVDSDAQHVSLIAAELEALIALFCKQLGALLGPVLAHDEFRVESLVDRSGVGYDVAVDSIQSSCIKWLELPRNEEEDIQEIAVEYKSKQVKLDSSAVASGNFSSHDYDARWIQLQACTQLMTSDIALAEEDASVQRQLQSEIEATLRRLQVHILCEEDSFKRHLESYPAPFLRDMIKVLHFASPFLGEFIVPNFSWNDAWTYSEPPTQVKKAFFETVGQAVKKACDAWGWSTDLDPKVAASAIVQSSASREILKFVSQVCLVAERAAAQNFSTQAASGLAACVMATGEYAVSFCSWVSGLQDRIGQLAAERHQAAEQHLAKQLANSQEGAAANASALEEAIRQLRVEKERHLEAQRRWDSERAALLQEVQQAKTEHEQLASQCKAAVQEKSDALRSKEDMQQELHEQIARWRSTAEDAQRQVALLQSELESSQQSLRPADAQILSEQLAITSMMLSMIEETRDSLAVAEAGQEVEDLVGCLDNLLRSQYDALKRIAGKSLEEKEFDLGMVGDFISGKRAKKRLLEAKKFSDSSGLDQSPGISSRADEKGSPHFQSGYDGPQSELCERLHMVLLSLAEQHASVGAARLEEERALVAYMRASLRKSWNHRQELARRLTDLEGLRKAEGLDQSAVKPSASIESGAQFDFNTTRLLCGQGSKQTPEALRALSSSIRLAAQTPEQYLVTLQSSQPEFCQLKALVEGTCGHGVTIVVRRIRKIANPRLEADFYEGVADQIQDASSAFTVTAFHGTSAILCELIAEEGFRLPHDLGTKLGPYGNAVHLANYSAHANAHCPGCPGRLRSFLVCDISPGRALTASNSQVRAGDFSNMSFDRMKSHAGPSDEVGYDSIFVAGSSDGQHGAYRDEYAVYDPRVVMPRYVVDFDIEGMGSEPNICESEGVEQLKAEVSHIIQKGDDSANIKEIRAKYKQIAESIQNVAGDTRLISIVRKEDPALWDRCVERLGQAAADGPGLPPGLEVVMTKLELIVNPATSIRFYQRAAALFYPEEPFQWLLHCPNGNDMSIIDHGLAIKSMTTESVTSQMEAEPYGRGVYFSTSLFKEAKQLTGTHRVALCEVALGKSMLAQSARPTLDFEAMERAGFDSLKASRRSADEYDLWVVYHADQALPVYLLSYDVQPKAVASELLNEIASLEERRRLLDEQMAIVLQDLENARRDAEETRLSLDEALVQQLVDEDRRLEQTKRQSQAQMEHMDQERASQLQELEKARNEGRGRFPESSGSSGQRLPAMDVAVASPASQQRRSPAPKESPGRPARNFSLPSLRSKR